MISNIITLFIGLANIIALVLVYYAFEKEDEKGKRLMKTMIAVGVMYIIALIVYGLSSIGLEKNSTLNTAKTMYIMAIVPVNTIIIEPILLRSYRKMQSGVISMDKLNKRAIIVGIMAIIICISEFFYFRNAQKNIIEMCKAQNELKATNNTIQNEYNEEINTNNSINNEVNNTIDNILTNNTLSNNTTK